MWKHVTEDVTSELNLKGRVTFELVRRAFPIEGPA